MEELESELEKRNIQIPFIGVDIYGMNKTIAELKNILGKEKGLLGYMED